MCLIDTTGQNRSLSGTKNHLANDVDALESSDSVFCKVGFSESCGDQLKYVSCGFFVAIATAVHLNFYVCVYGRLDIRSPPTFRQGLGSTFGRVNSALNEL